MRAKNEEMKNRFPEFSGLNLASIDEQILHFWKDEQIFEASTKIREDAQPFVFYEGPPSANGRPGIHHVLSRTIKDLFCRYKTMQGYRVDRKGGWDTHGLPVEIGVEKSLGITKNDIGTKISVEDYNAACRKDVLKFKDVWDDLTEKMGYWVDLDDPYITFENEYIESLWALLKRLYDKGLLYKGYTIQPFSPAAGTQLSSHELNMPGAYREVKDTTLVAQFTIERNEQSAKLFEDANEDLRFLAWTTTPWTLISNTALAVGAKIDYVKVKTYNPYTSAPVSVVLAKARLDYYFPPENAGLELDSYEKGQKNIPFKVCEEFKGSELTGISYEQLMPYVQPEEGDAFKVISGDFVTTDDGTGIVHIAPSFGADDMRVAQQNGIGALTLVNRQGRFVDEVTDFAGIPVKDYDDEPNYESVDIKIAVKLKTENKAFRVEKYEHSYPHCWRTDKPVIYYPLDSWFIRTTKVKERLLALNETINWKPKSTGEGRFGQWLESLVDWNLSRSRFWGTPLPIWRTEDQSEERCIGSIKELRDEVSKAVDAGFMKDQLTDDFDLHKPYVDRIVLVSSKGEPMHREPDLIDVWFDSGAMPYAQWHYPIENEEKFNANFPADFIAEGVDQTRGWFFTLHALGVMLFDSVAYKNVVSNGLVLDKNGNKMSKRLGNAVDPFIMLNQYGADATRWYLMSNSQPWDNLKFDEKGLAETTRKFFAKLFNSYGFFALYANIDGFAHKEEEIAIKERPEIDRWILSMLNSLVAEVTELMNDYEPTKACRLISTFVDDHLSNWYVRLCRRRFWKGDYSTDKIGAYQTLYTCIETISGLIAPIAPFFADFMFQALNNQTQLSQAKSIHLLDFPKVDENRIDKDLEHRMILAQDISSMVLSLRKKEKIKVRQPLAKMLIPVNDKRTENAIRKVEDYILSEVNVKEIEYVSDTSSIVSKKMRPNFKVLGPKFGKQMKAVKQAIEAVDQAGIRSFEENGQLELLVSGNSIHIGSEDVELVSEDIEGWLVASENDVTVALDTQITTILKQEGDAREFVNKLQNLRKDSDFEVTDRIDLTISIAPDFEPAMTRFKNYICSEILADNIQASSELQQGHEIDVNGIPLRVNISLKA